MSNYINDAYFEGDSTKSYSRYFVSEERQQTQWINNVAKQAAKLISDQIGEPKSCSKKLK